MAAPANEPIMLRVPPSMKKMVEDAAKEENVSQNTFLSASVFVSMLALGKIPIMGPPKNLLKVLEEIDQAAATDDDDRIVFGALHAADWDHVLSHLRSFEDSGYIKDLKFKPSGDTVAYRFNITKLGVSAFRMVTSFYRTFIASMKSIKVQEKEAAQAKQ